MYPPRRFGYAMEFPQWHRADLEGMIRRDRNHPSVILWSIGNEIDYPNDPYVTPLFKEVLGSNDANKPAAERLYDPRKPDVGRLAVLARELTDIAHAADDSRPVTSALSFPELSNRTGYADALDVVGYNYREGFYAEDHARYPGRPDDLTPYAERRRATLDGRAIVYLRAGRMADVLTLRAYTRGGLRAECSIVQRETDDKTEAP